MEKNKKTSSSNKSKRKPLKKKAKVKLDTRKVIMLCSIIACACILLLAVNVFLFSGSKGKVESPQISAVEKPAQKDSVKPKKDSATEKPSAKPKKDSDKTQGGSENKKKDSSAEKPSTPSTSDGASSTEKSTEKKAAPESTVKPEEKKTVPPAPKKSDENTPIDFAAAVNNAKLVIIFDDGGQNIEQLKKCLDLPFPVTVAVLPGLAHSVESASLVRKSGKELMLHQPMQAINLNVNPGPKAIKPDMSLQECEALLRSNIAEIGPVVGLNNHEGSLITEDENKMMSILTVADELGIFFLDSRTTSQTRVPEAAMALGYSYYQRDIFLDNEKTRANIISEVEKGLKIANAKGAVIMIGHVWSADILPSVLKEIYPYLTQKGYKFTTVTKSGAVIKP